MRTFGPADPRRRAVIGAIVLSLLVALVALGATPGLPPPATPPPPPVLTTPTSNVSSGTVDDGTGMDRTVGRRGAATATPPPTRSGASPTPTSAASPSPASSPSIDVGTDTSTGAGRKPTVGSIGAGPSSIQPGSVDRASLDLTATYDVDATLAWTTRKLAVDTRIVIENTSGGSIDRVELNTIAARLGGLELTAVEIDGAPATSSVDDQTITIPLGGVLAAGKTVRLRVAYSATLRSGTSGSDWLFTRANGVAALYRWIPWLSRPRDFDRPNHGDPFVTPSSPRVEVTVTADRSVVVAAPGRETETANGGRTHTFIATDVRDVALAIAPDYRVSTTTVDGVTLDVITRPGGPASTLRTQATRALEAYPGLVGAYPWDRLVVVQSAGGYGMESPGMVWIPPGAGNLDYLVHHEVAHQWFYGLVGNDQASEPYADEAMADMLARYVLKQRRSSRCAADDLDRTIYGYSSACYYEVIYIQGGNFLDDVRKQVGTSTFWRGVRDYLGAYRFRIGGTKQLLDAIDAATPKDLVPTYRPRFDRYY